LSRNFRLEPAERAEKIPSRVENARLSGSQVYLTWSEVSSNKGSAHRRKDGSSSNYTCFDLLWIYCTKQIQQQSTTNRNKWSL